MMKRVNLDGFLERKRDEVMEYFNRDNGPKTQPMPESVDDPSTLAGDDEAILARTIEALKTIYDPEIPVNIYDLGLIYRVNIVDGVAEVDMTLTTPGCPVAETFPGMVQRSVELVPGIKSASVDLVWEPPWSQDNISEAARLELGLI